MARREIASRIGRLVSCVIAVTATAGCGDDAVNNASARWTLEGPAVVIASEESGTTPPIGSARFGARLSNGRIVVADHQAADLKVFDADGKYVRSAGGRGGGPGEFRLILSMLRLPGDTIAVWSPPWLNLFDANGDFAGRELFDLDSPTGEEPFGFLALPDRALLVLIEQRADAPPESGLHRSEMDYHRQPRGGAATHLTRTPWVASFYDRGVPVSGPLFTINSEHAIGATRVYVGDNAGDTIHVFDASGQSLQPIVIGGEPRAPTREELDGAVADRIALAKRLVSRGPTTFSLQDLERLMPKVRDVSVYPRFRSLHPGPNDELWVEEYAPADSLHRRWLVYDADARLIADMLMPRRLEVFEIGMDYILGTHRDELDRDDIRLYRVARGLH